MKELKLDCYTLKPMDFSGIIRHYKPKISIWRWRVVRLRTEGVKAIDFSMAITKRSARDGEANNNDIKALKNLDGKVVCREEPGRCSGLREANIKTKDLRQFEH